MSFPSLKDQQPPLIYIYIKLNTTSRFIRLQTLKLPSVIKINSDGSIFCIFRIRSKYFEARGVFLTIESHQMTNMKKRIRQFRTQSGCKDLKLLRLAQLLEEKSNT